MIGSRERELNQHAIKQTSLMRENVMAFDDASHSGSSKRSCERTDQRTEERLPPLKDDHIRRKASHHSARARPGERVKRSKNLNRFCIERQVARVDLSCTRKKYSRVKLAKRDYLGLMAAGYNFPSQPINMVSNATSQGMRWTDDADS